MESVKSEDAADRGVDAIDDHKHQSLPQVMDSRSRSCSDGDGNVESEWLIEVKLMTVHAPSIFAKLISQLEVQGVHLVRGHLEDFLNTDSQVIFGRMGGAECHYSSRNIRDLKERLKGVLKSSKICGEILVKRIHRENAVMPKHVKFSELLQMGRNQNNPLLSNDAQSGFEIDISCSHYLPFLVLSISNIFELLDLDIRTIDAQIHRQSQHFVSSFFVQRRDVHVHVDSDSTDTVSTALRHRIECHIAEIFKKQNVAATIKTKMIEMGRHSISNTTKTKVQRQEPFKPPPLQIDDNQNPKDRDASAIALNITENPMASSPTSLSNTAQITESVIIITPKAQLAQPPSIEKQQLTLNVIGLTENGRISVSRQNTIEIINERPLRSGNQDDGVLDDDDDEDFEVKLEHELDADAKLIPLDQSKESSAGSSAHSSCSIIDILNETT